MNWLETSWDSTYINDFGSLIDEQVNYETYDLLIAVGPTVGIGGWNLYGGPFYYYLSGDMSVDGTDTHTDGLKMWKISGDLEADSNISGFVGAQVNLMDKYNITNEFSFTGDGWAIGVGVTVLF